MKRILVLNWRDKENPAAGGAEEYIHQIFGRLSAKGYSITLCSGSFKGCKKEEEIDGIRVVRYGGKFTLYFFAVFFYLLNRKKYDIVVESVNTIPYFLPFFVRRNLFVIIHHLAGKETYRLEVGRFLSLILTFVQTKLIHFYRSTPVITVSESTKSELLSRDFKNSNISVVYNGISFGKTFELVERNRFPTIIYIGRVSRIKRIEEILFSAKNVQSSLPGLTLYIGGRGNENYYRELESLAKRIDLKNIFFLGALTDEQKYFYLKKSWVYLIASVKEGWGISVIEANYAGLPVIGYKVPGIVDSVMDGKTGILVQDLDREAYQRAIEMLMNDHALRNKLSQNATDYSKRFSWDSSAEFFSELIK